MGGMMHQTKCKKKVNIRSFTALSLAFLTLFASLWFDDIFTPTRVVAAQGDGLSDHVIDTVSPSHVQFNLFDYWLVDRDTSSANAYRPVQGGINSGHPFVFGGLSGWGPWNVWTGTDNHYNTLPNQPGIRYGRYEGIVKNTCK